MDYIKIAELAHECQAQRQQIFEHYRMVGANGSFTEDVKAVFYSRIKEMEKELEKKTNKLKKLIS